MMDMTTDSPSTCVKTPSYQSTLSPLRGTSLEALGSPASEPVIVERPLMLVNTALIFAQICFGLGGIISALGLPACNPFAFALYREIAAGTVLGVGAVVLSSPANRGDNNRMDAGPRFLLLGMALFGNQACVIAGIKLAGPVAAAVWQPSQPIITAGLSMILGWEPLICKRVVGVFLSFLGCSIMVILSSNRDGSGTSQNESDIEIETPPHRALRIIVGHCLFFINCLCTSLYVLLSKVPLLKYCPLQVTAWSYNIAAAFMLITSYLSSLSPPTINFLCPDCVSTWVIPTGAVWALVYAILFNSVLAYYLIQWSNQHATGTLVMGYSTLQPVTVAILTALLIGSGMVPRCSDCAFPPNDGGSSSSSNNNSIPVGSIDDTAKAFRCLDAPGWGTLVGMLGVCSGLWLVIATEPENSHGKSVGDAPSFDSTLRSHTYRKVSTILSPDQ